MKPYYYVYRTGYGPPTIKHTTLEAVAKEAERLALQHPGETFEILACVGIAQIPEVKTTWMDGIWRTGTPPEPTQKIDNHQQP